MIVFFRIKIRRKFAI